MEYDSPVPPENGDAPGGYAELAGRVLVAYVKQLDPVGVQNPNFTQELIHSVHHIHSSSERKIALIACHCESCWVHLHEFHWVSAGSLQLISHWHNGKIQTITFTCKFHHISAWSKRKTFSYTSLCMQLVKSLRL